MMSRRIGVAWELVECRSVLVVAPAMLASSGHPALPAANRPIFNPGLRLRSCARRALNEQPSRDFWSIFSHLCVGFMLNCLFLSTLTGGHLPSAPNHCLGQAESSDFYQGFCALGQRNPLFLLLEAKIFWRGHSSLRFRHCVPCQAESATVPS